MKDLKEFFEENASSFLASDEPCYIRQKRIIDKLWPLCNRSLINHSTHEKIYFDVDPDVFANALTDEEIIELISYGLLYDDDCESLEMYV